MLQDSLMRTVTPFGVFLLLALGWPCLAQQAVELSPPIAIEKPDLGRPVDFATDIAPLLRKNCTACHQGADAEAGLVLDSPQAIVQGGDSGSAVNLQSPEQSLLVRLSARLEKPHMPPRRNKVDAVPLTPKELGLLTLWIEQGAKGQTNRLPPAPSFQTTPLGWSPAYAVAVSPDARWIAFGRGNTLSLYDRATGRTRSLSAPDLKEAADPDAVHSLAFSEDGTRLAMGGFRAIRIWKQLESESRHRLSQAPVAAVQATAVSADQSRIAVVEAQAVKVLDAASGAVVAEFGLNPAAQNSVQQAADYLAYAQREMKAQTDWVAAATAIANELQTQLTQAQATLTAADQDLTTKQSAVQAAATELDAAKAAVAAAMQALGQAEAGLAAADQSLAEANQANPANPEAVAQATAAKQAAEQGVAQARATLEQTKSQQTAAEQKKSAAEPLVPPAVTAKQNAEQKVTELNKTVQSQQENLQLAHAAVAATQPLLDEATARQKRAADYLNAPKFSGGVLFVPSGDRLWLGQQDGSVWVQPLQAGAQGMALKLHDHAVVALSMTTEGKVLSIASDGEVRAASVETEWAFERALTPPESQGPPVDRVLSLGFSPDGQWLAAGGGVPSREGELSLWKVDDGALVRSYDLPHSDSLLDAAYWRDGHRLATGAADKFAKVFSPHDGSRMRAFEGHTGHVMSLSWNYSGHTLVTSGADRVLKVWQFHDGKQLKTIEGFDKQVVRVRHLGYRPELAAAWGDKVQIINEDGTRGQAFHTAGDHIHSMAVSRDGRLVVAGGHSGRIYAWDTATGQQVLSLER